MTIEIFFLYFSLFCFGLLFGSFSSVLISRWKHKETGILMGRSFCPKCKNTLTARELIPIFSYLFQKGKCRHCGVKIPFRYPILEWVMGFIFMLFGYIATEIFLLPLPSIAFFWLIFLGFITVVYIFYDIFYTEIPEEVFVLWVFGTIFLIIFSYIFPEEVQNIFFNWHFWDTDFSFLKDKFLGAWILYSFLFLQIFISGSLFFLKNRRYKDIWELFFLYFLFPFLTIYDFFREKFFAKNEKSDEREEEIPLWVWPGDLFLAIIIGGTLGVVHGIVAFFIAYLVGSVISVMFAIYKGKNFSSQVPFWPFLGIGFILASILYPQIKEFVNTYFLYYL